MLSVPTVLAVYRQTQRDAQLRLTQIPQPNDYALEPSGSPSGVESFVSQDEIRPRSVSTSTSDLAKRTPESSAVTEEQHLDSSSAEAWVSYNDTLKVSDITDISALVTLTFCRGSISALHHHHPF